MLDGTSTSKPQSGKQHPPLPVTSLCPAGVLQCSVDLVTYQPDLQWRQVAVRMWAQPSDSPLLG